MYGVEQSFLSVVVFRKSGDLEKKGLSLGVTRVAQAVVLIPTRGRVYCEAVAVAVVQRALHSRLDGSFFVVRYDFSCVDEGQSEKFENGLFFENVEGIINGICWVVVEMSHYPTM